MRRISFALVCVACSSNEVTDAGADAFVDDATNACSVLTSDASFSCDVSAVPPADRGCGNWVGAAAGAEGGALSCPAAGSGWSSGIGSECNYTWQKPGPADLCGLPTAEDGRTAFGWLHPTCDNGCDASIDVAPPTPCTTSADCPSTQYCEKHGDCTAAGTCFPISGGIGAPGQVCGCDNQTYASGGAAHQARVSIAYTGACE